MRIRIKLVICWGLCWFFVFLGDCFIFFKYGKEFVNSSIYLGIIKEKMRNIWKGDICFDCEFVNVNLLNMYESFISKFK